MHRFRHPLEDGADLLRSAEPLHEFVGGVGRLQHREDEDVRRAPRKLAEREQAGENPGNHRGVGMHRPIDDQVRLFLRENAQRLLHLRDPRSPGGAEVGVGDERHPRGDSELARRLRRLPRDLGQGPAIRADVDRGIGEEIHLIAREHDVHTADPAGPGLEAHDLHAGTDRLGKSLGDPGDHAVGVAHPHHHGSEVVCGTHGDARPVQGLPLALPQPVVLQDIVLEARVVLRVDDHGVAEIEVELAAFPLDLVPSPEEDRLRHFLLADHGGGAEDAAVLPLRVDDPLGRAAGLVDDRAHDAAGLPEQALEAVAILVEIERLLRHSGFHGGARYGQRLPDQNARIERLGNQVLAAEVEVLVAIRLAHRVGHILLGQIREGVGSRHLHLFVDGGGPAVQRAAEDEGEAENVVDLVRVVGPPGGHDDVLAGGHRVRVGNLGIGVGHGEDDRIRVHVVQPGGLQEPLPGEAEENVGALERVLQRAGLGLAGELLLVGVHPLGATLVDHSLRVEHEDVLELDPEIHIVLGTRDAGGSRSRNHHLRLRRFASRQLEGVDQRGPRDDGRAVLVVVEDRNLHRALQLFLDEEALGRLDVLEIDPAERGFQKLAGTDDLL